MTIEKAKALVAETDALLKDSTTELEQYLFRAFRDELEAFIKLDIETRRRK